MLNDPSLQKFTVRYLNYVLLGMVTGAIGLFVIFSVGPDGFFWGELQEVRDDHNSFEQAHAELREYDISESARIDLLDGRLQYQENALSAHGSEYDEFADMLDSRLNMLMSQIEQTTYGTELQRRYDRLEIEKTLLIDARRDLRGQWVRLKRIYDGNAAAPATQLEIDEFVRVEGEIQEIDRRVRVIESEQQEISRLSTGSVR